jgi:hypothetical protein
VNGRALLRSIRYFLSEQVRLLRDMATRVGEMLRPRIKQLQIGLKKIQVESQREEYLETLGKMAHGQLSSNADLLDRVKKSATIQPIVKKIEVINRLEKKLQGDFHFLEETQLIWVLSNLSAELASQRVEVGAHWIREDSPFKGWSLNDIRQQTDEPGFVALGALKSGYPVQLSQDTPLQDSDILIYLAPVQKEIPAIGGPNWKLHSNT